MWLTNTYAVCGLHETRIDGFLPTHKPAQPHTSHKSAKQAAQSIDNIGGSNEAPLLAQVFCSKSAETILEQLTMDTVTQKVTTRLVNLHDLQGPAATRQQDLRRILTQI